MTEQLEVVPVPIWLRVQVALGLKLPVAVPAFAKLTEPCGHDFAGESVSDTVAVQVVLSAIGVEDGEQLTLVEVVRFVTVNAKPVAVLLFAWTESSAV